jgi:hypothetical protein
VATTTIRVPIAVREKLGQLSKAEGEPIGRLLERLTEEHERKRFFEQMAEGYRRLRENPEEWAGFQRELSAWDVTLMDGLEEDWEE